jgi:hypothetical protein
LTLNPPGVGAGADFLLVFLPFFGVSVFWLLEVSVGLSLGFSCAAAVEGIKTRVLAQMLNTISAAQNGRTIALYIKQPPGYRLKQAIRRFKWVTFLKIYDAQK